MILLIGTPRSGSTWFAKIFDSHPDTLYRHEPDSVLPAPGIPHVVPVDEVGRHRDAAARYLEAISRLGSVKTAGVAPAFPKSYAGGAAVAARTALVTILKLGETASVLRPALAKVPVPDLVSTGTPRIVVKSVIGLGRARLYSEALTRGHQLLLLRHPCAYVASQLRGMSVGNMSGFAVAGEWLTAEPLRRRGLDRDAISAMSPAGRFACHWLAFNEKALEETAGRDNTRVVIYEDLCRNPVAVARDAFEWCGLEWHGQTETFIGSSTQVDHDPGYFELKRNSADDVDKWSRELDEDTRRTVLELVSGSAAAAHYGL